MSEPQPAEIEDVPNPADNWTEEDWEVYAAGQLDAWEADRWEIFGQDDDGEDVARRGARSGFRMIPATALSALPAPEWLIPGFLERGSLAFLYGGPGTYKSFHALHHALSLAGAGRTVTYIAAEGFSGYGKRVAAWAAQYAEGVVPEGLTMITQLDYLTSPEVQGDMQEHLAETKPCLVIVDTLARTIDGDENSAKDAAAYIKACEHLQADDPARTVLLIHHSGHGKEDSPGERMRGSSALKAASDTVIRQNKISVTVERSKNYESGNETRYRMRTHPTPQGDSLAFVLTDEPADPEPEKDGPLNLKSRVRVAVHTEPGLSKTQITERVTGKATSISDRLEELVTEGGLRVESGPRNSTLYFPTVADEVLLDYIRNLPETGNRELSV